MYVPTIRLHVYWLSVNRNLTSGGLDTAPHMQHPFVDPQAAARKTLRIGRLSQVGACFARYGQLALSNDEPFTSFQFVLMSPYAR
ncbi:MAG: hypothetical protein MUQ10_05695 [Anaerolineae bacterium]|nr:hypothetical protein [Anaerolineae bacterium]